MGVGYLLTKTVLVFALTGLILFCVRMMCGVWTARICDSKIKLYSLFERIIFTVLFSSLIVLSLLSVFAIIKP